jgi:uncharacterized protein YqgQ
MQSFDKSYIISKVEELKTHLINYVYNRKIDLNACRELFTNDFAFFAFQKCLKKLDEILYVPSIHLVKDANSNNVFLICKDWLFGVNDDGRVFVVVNSNWNSQSLKSIYQQFGYDYDILDNCIRNKIVFNTNKSKDTIRLKFTRKDIKTYDSKWIRVCGDLLMRYDNSNLVIYHFKELFDLYINELWMQRLSEHGIIVHTTGKPYTVHVGKQDSQIKKLLIHELINVLKYANCEVINHEDIEHTTKLDCRFSDVTFNVSFQFVSFVGGYQFYVKFDIKDKTINRLKFVKSVLTTVGIDASEQNIVINFGNHKIILHGYYFPLLTVGTSLISFDRYFATKILLQHPEHHDIEVIFPDLVGIEFDTIQVTPSQQLLRNEYFANKWLV